MATKALIPPIEERSVSVVTRPGGVCAARFLALGSPCEILLATGDTERARRLAQAGVAEAWRIERKYSRYRPDSIVSRINASQGVPVPVDTETAHLLDYAAHCHVLSEGRFDITSGVLRHAWNFDGSGRVPDAALVESLRQRVGFGSLRRSGTTVQLPAGMEIDLGGIAKEYAVDRALDILAVAPEPVLVNFGGDLRASAPPGAVPWQVAVEAPERTEATSGDKGPPAFVLELTRGALATSGDAHRYVLNEGRRYGHLLDPTTGWPVRDAPHSVTVAAATCVEAGTWSTLAMLQGVRAESFLEELGLRYWCIR